MIETEHVIVAIGHSARDTFYDLYESGVHFTAKPFAVGVRVEHPQSLIDMSTIQLLGHEKLEQLISSDSHRFKWSWCVYLLYVSRWIGRPSSSEKGRLVTNGMSEHARDQENANSALLVQVFPEDFGSDHPLAGVEFQRRLEEKAFGLGGSDYKAPAQLVGDFLKGQASKTLGTVTPSYALGVELTNLNRLLPDYITEAMADGLEAFDRKLKGFAMNDAVMTGVESRSSSPVRIDRDSRFYKNL